MEILERARELEGEGANIVHLEVGEPDFNVPDHVEQAMTDAVRRGDTHYTHSLGELAFREAVSEYYAHRGIDVSPHRILATLGSSGALALVMAYLLDPGDEVLIPDPGYACYPNFVRAFHGRPVPFAVRPENAFQYDVDDIAALVGDNTRALFVNSPSNPTAVVQDRQVLERVAQLGVSVISDEIYHGLEYGERATSILSITDDAFVVDGCSKRYAMTGLRIGWVVAPKAAVPVLQKLQQNLFVCTSSVAQRGAISALQNGDDDVARMLDEYRGRRDVLLRGLRDLGFEIPGEPEGAYYVLADASHISTDSLALARRILEEAHVGVTPGIDFGERAEGFLRFSFATSLDRIREGLDRLRGWLG